MSRSETAAHREVRRATIILMAADGARYDVIGETVQCSPDSVSRWVERFNETGLSGLDDRPRPGRQRIYSEQERGQMIAVPRTHPEQLGQAFGRWTLTRLMEYIHSALRIALSHPQLARRLQAERSPCYQKSTSF